MSSRTSRSPETVVVGWQASADDATDDSDQTLRRLRKACEYAELNFDERLTLAKVATVAGFERTYFSRLFKHRMGIGFTEWLRELRISHAMRLLLEPQVSIAQVGLSVGYFDISTFERNFRASKGMSPSEFRRAYGVVRSSGAGGSNSVEGFIGF